MADPWGEFQDADAFSEFQDAPVNKPKSQGLGFVKGAFKPLDNLALAAESGLGAMGVPVEQIGAALGGTARQAVDQREAAIEASPNAPGGWGEAAGNIAGTLPTMYLPGGPLVQGVADGLLLTNADSLPGMAQDAALGAAGGFLGNKVADAVASGAKHITDPAVQMLQKAGVKLTPGQALGGALKRWEDKATSQPFVGGAIDRGRDEALEGFNKAGYARVLDEIGEKLPAGLRAGHDAVAYVGDRVSDFYERTVPGLKIVKDDQLIADLGQLVDLAKLLPAEKAKQLAGIIDNQLFDKFASPVGRASGNLPAIPGQGVASAPAELTGEALKRTHSQLGKLARRFSQQIGDADQQTIGEGLSVARKALADALMRQNPDARQALKAADTAYANLLRIEKAASAVGAKEGRVTPQQLATSVKALDGSGGKKAVARGEALMQDLSKAGQKVLQSSLPDSGTAGRMAVLNPVAAAMGGAGYVGYQGAKALAAALKRLPPNVAAQLEHLTGPAGLLGSVGALQLSSE